MIRELTTFALVLGLLAAPAHAYVLPADFIVKMRAERLRGQRLQDLSLQLQTHVAGSSESIEERIYIKRPNRLRRVIGEGEQAEVYVENEGQHATGVPNKLQRRTGTTLDLTATLFSMATRDLDDVATKVINTFRSLRVDTSIVSLGRSERELVYIVGARPWEPDKPQVWFSKENYYPVRVVLIVPSSDGDGSTTRLETRYREYGSDVAGRWFPRVVEELRNGRVVRISEVHQVQVNQELPETLFEIP